MILFPLLCAFGDIVYHFNITGGGAILTFQHLDLNAVGGSAVGKKGLAVSAPGADQAAMIGAANAEPVVVARLAQHILAANAKKLFRRGVYKGPVGIGVGNPHREGHSV